MAQTRKPGCHAPGKSRKGRSQTSSPCSTLDGGGCHYHSSDLLRASWKTTGVPVERQIGEGSRQTVWRLISLPPLQMCSLTQLGQVTSQNGQHWLEILTRLPGISSMPGGWGGSSPRKLQSELTTLNLSALVVHRLTDEYI